MPVLAKSEFMVHHGRNAQRPLKCDALKHILAAGAIYSQYNLKDILLNYFLNFEPRVLKGIPEKQGLMLHFSKMLLLF